MAKSSPRPRRQARQARSRETIDAILDAAAQVLLRRGYVHATTNHIADRAGVSVGTLYQYFEDKDAVFAAIIDREAARLLAFVNSEAPAAPEKLQAKLLWFFSRSIAMQKYGNQLLRVLEQVPNALLRKRIEDVRQILVGLAAELLRMHRDELTVEDVDLAAWVLIHASSSLAYDAPPALFQEKLAHEMTVLFTRYLTAREQGA